MLNSFTAAALAATAGIATAAPTVYETLDGSGPLVSRDDTRIEARLKADYTNWDSRLEVSSFPVAGDNQGHLGNGRAFFEGRTFAFDLSYAQATGLVTWTITRPDASTSSLSLAATGFDTLNTIQLFTVGTRGNVDISDLAFTGLGMDVDLSSLNFNSSPSDTFNETFLHFGNDFDLLSGDWSLTGRLTFSNLTTSNPNENAKLTVKLRNAVDPTVPAPAGAGLLALAGLAAARRRR